MFDIRNDLLVFVTQTHHPVLEHHTGYIFAEYRVTYRKPRELFFQHYYEVVVYALHMGADIELDPDRKPDIVTALDYVLNQQDDSQYASTGAHPFEGTDVQMSRRLRKQQREADLPATDVQAWDAEEEKGTGLGAEFGDMPPGEGNVDDIDFFGE